MKPGNPSVMRGRMVEQIPRARSIEQVEKLLMYQLPKSRAIGVNTCDACLKKQREIDRLREEVDCATSQRAVCATAPGVLPKSLFGNQLTAHVLTSHYLHGEPLGAESANA